MPPPAVPGVYCGGELSGKPCVPGVPTRAVTGTCAGVGGVTCHAESLCGVLRTTHRAPIRH